MDQPSTAPHETMVAAILAFLMLIKDEPDADGGGLKRLAGALDRLVMEYHRAPEVRPDDKAGAPTIDNARLAAQAAASFPELREYADVDPLGGLAQPPMAGDAIDDLADIARDLTEVLWHLDNVGVNDAVWVFRFGYETHWGRHLHNVRRYLHALLNRDE